MNVWIEEHFNKQPAQVTTGEVKAVDTTDFTCTVTRVDRPELFNVRLNACEYNGDRFVMVPRVGSVVLVCVIEKDEAEGLIIACSEIDQVLIKIGQSSISVKATEVKAEVGTSSLLMAADGNVTINGGTLGGLAKITQLLSALNSIKTYSTDMKTAVANAFQNIPSQYGGLVAAASFNLAMNPKSIVIPDDLENPKVKQ